MLERHLHTVRASTNTLSSRRNVVWPKPSDNVVLKDGDRPARFQPLVPQDDKEQPVMVKLRNTVMQWCH